VLCHVVWNVWRSGQENWVRYFAAMGHHRPDFKLSVWVAYGVLSPLSLMVACAG
jgi:hypothetical protein